MGEDGHSERNDDIDSPTPREMFRGKRDDGETPVEEPTAEAPPSGEPVMLAFPIALVPGFQRFTYQFVQSPGGKLLMITIQWGNVTGVLDMDQDAAMKLSDDIRENMTGLKVVRA